MTEKTKRKPKFTRVPSSIQFPYTDMSDAIAVADGLLKGGGTPMSRDQLAAAMGLSPGGGGFGTKIGTARLFGVMDGTAGTYQLTDLGFEVMDPSRQQEARVRAFLNVELYRRTYEEFRGKLLPPRPHGLEAAFKNFGVTAKNVEAARRAFEKSARLAGMYPGGNEDRLVMPFGAAAPVAADGDGIDLTKPPKAAPPPPPPPPAPRVLEYELVDLLKMEGIGDEESAAIWTLVRFLTTKKKAPPPAK
jgi:hypothetical protein